MYLIGITGKKGSGKDTAFGTIRTWATGHGVLAERRGFADKLKLSAARIFNPTIELEEALEWCDRVKQPEVGLEVHEWDREYKPFAADDEMYDTCIVDYEITGRQFLQHYGTEAHRQVFGDNFWIDQVLPTGYETPVQPKWWSNFDVDTVFAVITDVRFPNEAERVKELGGTIFEIHRNSGSAEDGHASEQPLPAEFVDQTIYNASSLEVFKNTVKTVMDDRYGMVELKPNRVTTDIKIGDPK